MCWHVNYSYRYPFNPRTVFDNNVVPSFHETSGRPYRHNTRCVCSVSDTRGVRDISNPYSCKPGRRSDEMNRQSTFSGFRNGNYTGEKN